MADDEWGIVVKVAWSPMENLAVGEIGLLIDPTQAKPFPDFKVDVLDIDEHIPSEQDSYIDSEDDVEVGFMLK